MKGFYRYRLHDNITDKDILKTDSKEKIGITIDSYGLKINGFEYNRHIGMMTVFLTFDNLFDTIFI